MRRLAVSLPIGLFALLSGCASSCDERQPSRTQGFRAPLPAEARRVLEHADSLELFATAPEISRVPADAGGGETFHGYTIRGRALVDGADEQKRITSLVLAGLDNQTSTMVACNEPRHGFRFHLEGQTVDLHLSLGCLHGTLYAGATRSTVLTAADGKAELDEIFARHHIPVDE